LQTFYSFKVRRLQMNESGTSAGDVTGPRWKPLSSLQRRIVGVLVEKAKTTPDQYPLSLNALRAGCNQKSNRDPVMEVSDDDIERSLDQLREVGAVAEVVGGGRVPRFRHYMYEWLGVDKVELAVMAELLLRGAQSEGDLRGRAARMEPIADLTALRPVLDSLKSKGLVIGLTPQGRGHMVTHALYPAEELARIKAQAPAMAAQDDDPAPPSRPSPVAPTTMSQAAPRPTAITAAPSGEVASLRQELAELRGEVESLSQQIQRGLDEIRDLREQLGA
jgi:uncharacterized protein YceH (UPF0502 family)